MVKRTMMQMVDAANTKPVNIHNHIRWNLLGFMMRFRRAAIASFGVVKDMIPNAKFA